MNIDREYNHGSALERVRGKASELFRLYNAPCPEPQFGEGVDRYRKRVLSVAALFLPDSSPWRSVNPHAQPDRALDAMERQIIDDSITAFKAPVGPLRSVVETDEAGRRIRKFYGSPEDCWGPFKGQQRRVAGWTSSGRGRDSPAARAAIPVSVRMSDGTVRRL